MNQKQKHDLTNLLPAETLPLNHRTIPKHLLKLRRLDERGKSLKTQSRAYISAASTAPPPSPSR